MLVDLLIGTSAGVRIMEIGLGKRYFPHLRLGRYFVFLAQKPKDSTIAKTFAVCVVVFLSVFPSFAKKIDRKQISNGVEVG